MTASQTTAGGPAGRCRRRWTRRSRSAWCSRAWTGILEVIGGIVLLFLSPQAIQHLARTLTAHEPCGTRPRPAPGHSPQVLTGDRVRIADRGDSAAPRRG